MKENESLDSIDLNDFIVSTDNDTSKLCRSVLRTVVLSEEIRLHELDEQKSISAQTQRELQSILRRSQSYAEILENLIKEVDPKERIRLQAVSTKLLEIGLKLKREIIKLSEHKAEKSLDKISGKRESSPKKKIVKLPPVVTSVPASAQEPTNRFLLAGTAILILLAGTYFYVNLESAIPDPVSPLVEKLEPGELPSGQHLKVGYKQDSMLFVTAKDSWKKLSADEQRENLEELFAIPSETKIKNVVITDGNGNLLGDVSAEGVRFEGADSAEGVTEIN